MSITTEDLQELAAYGGGMIFHSKIYNVQEIKKIASPGSGNIVFDLS